MARGLQAADKGWNLFTRGKECAWEGVVPTLFSLAHHPGDTWGLWASFRWRSWDHCGKYGILEGREKEADGGRQLLPTCGEERHCFNHWTSIWLFARG
jgi:hypothetical protein